MMSVATPARASARQTRVRSMRLPALVAGVGLVSIIVLHFRDPHVDGSYGLCPFHVLTGLWCPGCGGLRAVNDLTRLDLSAAVSSNVLVVALVAVLVVAYLRWLPRRWRGESVRMIVLGPRMTSAVLATIVLFAVVRNTPLGAWLAP